MSFYVQHGYGKSDKIAALAGIDGTTGIILSPGDEDVSALAATVASSTALGLDVLLDPQAYIYSLNPTGSARKHEDHELELGAMHWSQDAAAVSRHVDDVERANDRVGVRGTRIAPTCFQSSFHDVWTPLALQYARTAAAAWGGDRTIATVAIEESAFDDWAAVADWLDVATTVDVEGFYLLIARQRQPGYPPGPWDPGRLANVLRLIYNLSVVNEYRVLWGYSDIEGLVGISAGADGLGSGWHYTLRAFTPSKWQPSTSTGGRPPAARIHLGRLWSPLRAEDEAESLFRSRLRDEVFSRALIDRFATRGFDTWTRAEAQEQHLKLLARRSQRLVAAGAVPDRLALIEQSLSSAGERFGQIRGLGIELPAIYPSRILAFREALAAFAAAEGL